MKDDMATKVNMDRHIREGWTVGAFIRELAPQVEMIMSGQSWREPFRNKQELADWCRDNQPYYKASSTTCGMPGVRKSAGQSSRKCTHIFGKNGV